MSYRTCKDCGQQFPLTRKYFGSTPSGFRYQCRACKSAYQRNYDTATPERRQAASERAMRRRGTTFSSFDRELFRQQLIGRDGSDCFYCGTELNAYNFHIDHKTPINKGGAHGDLDNLALACMQCNQEKYNRDVAEYRAWRRWNGLDVRF